MIVSREELENLQAWIQKQLKELQSQPSQDADQEFNLQTMDSNISLVLSFAEFNDLQTLELGTRDSGVINALEAFRSENGQKADDDTFAGQVSYYASEAVRNIIQAKDSLPEEEKTFSRNIEWKLNQVLPVLKEIAGLSGNARLIQQLREKDFVSLESSQKRTVRTAAAAPSVSVSHETEIEKVSKPAAKTVKTAKASAEKTETKASKSSASKTAASKTTAAKTAKTIASKTIASKTAAAKSTAKTAKSSSRKEAEEAPKKRGRPRKSE